MNEPVILVVDDDQGAQSALIQVLRREKYVADGTSCAREALEKLSEKSYDLVITDIRMPGEIDGLGLVHWIRENRPNLPVIITSGARRDDGIAEAASGACFFEKPYDCAMVANQIHQMIEATPTSQDRAN